MQYGVIVPNFGDCFDPRVLADMARDAARWDGVVPMRSGQGLGEVLAPDGLREVVAYVRQHRDGDAPLAW